MAKLVPNKDNFENPVVGTAVGVTSMTDGREAPVGQEKNDADESAQSRQASFPRTFRIFPPQNVSLPSEGSERSPAVPIYEQQTGALDTTD